MSLRAHIAGLMASAALGGAPADTYAILGFSPPVVADFENEVYRVGGSTSDFDTMFDLGTTTAYPTTNGTMVDSDGVLKWRPHNLLTYSEDTANAANWTESTATATDATGVVTAPAEVSSQNVTTITASAGFGSHIIFSNPATLVSGIKYKYTVFIKNGTAGYAGFGDVSAGGETPLIGIDLSTGSYTNADGEADSVTITDAGNDWLKCELFHTKTDTSTNIGVYVENDTSIGNWTALGTETIHICAPSIQRADLDVADNPNTGSTYVPTTTAARYLHRRGNHVYNGSSWVNKGILLETAARTNLLLNSGTLATQNVTTSATPYTLSFTGTGTVTLSGTSTAGPLVGTGTGENNRVNLTFTPTAGTLTLTVSGTVTNAQLEAGSTPSSYIPTAGATVTRAAEEREMDGADLPYSATAMSGALERLITYADTNSATQQTLFDWRADADNRITITLDTAGGNTGKVTLTVVDTASSVSVTSTADLTPGVNVAAKIAWRVTTSHINIALNGTAETQVSNTAGIPDVSAAVATFGGMTNSALDRIWGVDIGDAGLEAAST